jgi:ubiquinone/menaquinone biosynthesis C-methylase UbiE
MDDHIVSVFYDVFSDLPRQGPGDAKSTAKALSFISERPAHPHILDVGCGSGAQTLDLARLIDGEILAVDNHQPFLDALQLKAAEQGLSGRIRVLNSDMNDLHLGDQKFDIIWSEGAIYIMGFEKGLKEMQRLLKPIGYVAVTEVSWLKPDPPAELCEFWNREYPAIQSIDLNLNVVKEAGYSLISHFILPTSSWSDNYYNPLESRLQKMRSKYAGDDSALEVVEACQLEIDLFRKYSDYYGYVFYLMRTQ